MPAPMTFDPSAAEATRWRHWLTAALAERDIPPDGVLELSLRPHGEVAMTRLCLDLDWAAADVERCAHAEVLVPLRRVLGAGWAGWPAYIVAIQLLRQLGDDNRLAVDASREEGTVQEPERRSADVRVDRGAGAPRG